VQPPRIEHRVDAVYPAGELHDGIESEVELFVVVNADGHVGKVEVVTSGGTAFDDAAVAAVRRWSFEPARRNGQAVASRIRVPFSFTLPSESDHRTEVSLSNQHHDHHHGGEQQTLNLENPQVVAPGAIEEVPEEVVVSGQRKRRTEIRTASDFELDADLIEAAPHAEGADVLKVVPGLYVGRAAGPAVAQNYMLRGFDAEHGQDIAFSVGGLPINLPSHIHGQGYADLGFLIDATVSQIHVHEGVHDPSQGDFAVAGSIDISLGVEEQHRGVTLRSGYGSFDTFRQLAMWAPRSQSEETFGAVEYTRSSGFGENRGGQRASGILQHRFGQGEMTYRAIAFLYTARADLAGVVRNDDIDDGTVCALCVYPYPTAQEQNAQSSRFMSGLFADYVGKKGDSGQLGVWLGFDDFRLRRNFTGFVERSQTLENVSGRGDLIDQQNQTLSLGLTGRYRSEHMRPVSWAHGSIEVGTSGRIDVIDQSSNLIDASAHDQIWDRRVLAEVRAVDLGFYGDLDWEFRPKLSARIGLRADVLSYDVDDQLGNFAPSSRPQDAYIPGFSRSALGTTWNPRASVQYRPLWWLSFLAAYGQGFRSPQARTLEDGEKTPFTKVNSADLGARADFGKELQITAGGYFTRLSDDVAFDAQQGSLERVGASQRLGLVSAIVARPIESIIASLSVTWVDATLLEPPPASAEEPQPPFEKGQSLPFVPPVVLRADLGSKKVLLEDLGGRELEGRVGIGFSYLSSRPLPYGQFADPVALLDASAGLLWGAFDLGLEMFNIANAQYAAFEYSYASDWNPSDGFRPRTPARHSAAGMPFSWMVTLGVNL
jgi:TonB family protein